MPYVSVYVETDDIMDDLDASEIAKELVKRHGWQEAIAEAAKARHGEGFQIEPDDVDLMLKDFYFGFPIDETLQKLCHQRLGVFKPISTN